MRKKGILLALAALACTFVGAATACKDDNGDFTGFKEGHATNVMIGETVRLNEFIDVKDSDKYTLIASNGIEEIDLSDKPTWYPEVTGVWTLTLKITSGKNKGTYTMDLDIAFPAASFDYNKNTLLYEYGSTLSFKKLLADLRIDVDSFDEYEEYIYNVRVGKDVVIEFDKDDTSYTFVDYEPHYFTFGIETGEGQILKAIANVSVQEEDVAAVKYCEENNIEAYGHQKLFYRNGELSAQMSAGSYRDYFVNANVPYIAFNGEYETDSYVSVDFTGKNIPQTAFFCDVVTKDLCDKNQGIYISHGTVNLNNKEQVGGDWSCLTFFGPNKMKDKHVNTGGSFGREGWPSNPHPASREGLQDGVRYRYIVGYTNPVVGTADKTYERGNITLRMLLINLDTNEIVTDMTKTLWANEQTGILEEKHFKGSIVLYGNYTVTTTWDNIRLIEEYVGDIYDLYPTINFKKGAPEYAVTGDVIQPTDYLDAATLASGNLYWSYKANELAAEGEDKPFTEPLTIEKVEGQKDAYGAYRIKFVPNDPSVNPRSIVLYANDTNAANNYKLDFEDGVRNAIQGQYRAGAYLYDYTTETDENKAAWGKPINGDKSVRLNVGTIFGGDASRWGIDFEYLDKLFADTSVQNAIFKMKSATSITLNSQIGYQSNGNASYDAGIFLQKDQLTFIAISRKNYEAARANPVNGMYLLRFLAGAEAVSRFNVLLDDLSVGTSVDGGIFIYQKGVDVSHTFEGTPTKLFFAGEEITDEVTVDGNKVILPASYLQAHVGKKVQLVAETENGIEIASYEIADSVSMYIINYGDDDVRNSRTVLEYKVLGTVNGVKVGDDEISYTQSGNTLSIPKLQLSKYAGQADVKLTIKLQPLTGDEVDLLLAIDVKLMNIPTFDEENEIIFFETENVGAMEVIEGTEELPAVNGSNLYRITLPVMEKGQHKVSIPLEVLDEIFSQPHVDAFRFNVGLSFGKSGTYLTYNNKAGSYDGYSTELLKGNLERTQAIDRDLYEVLKMSGSGYVMTVDSALHGDEVGYMYLDHFRIEGAWTVKEVTFTRVQALSNKAVFSGFYGNVTKVVNKNNTDTDWSEHFNGIGTNTITLKPALNSYNAIKNTTIAVITDKGITYWFKVTM